MIENPLCSPGHPRILTNDASMLWPSLLGNVLQGLTYLAHVVAKLTFLWEQLFFFSTHNFQVKLWVEKQNSCFEAYNLARLENYLDPLTHLISFVLSSVLNLIYFPWSSFETKVWGEWSCKFWFIQLLQGYTTHITTDVEFVTSSAFVNFFWARVKVSRIKCEKLPFLMMNIDLKLWLFEG